MIQSEFGHLVLEPLLLLSSPTRNTCVHARTEIFQNKSTIPYRIRVILAESRFLIQEFNVKQFVGMFWDVYSLDNFCKEYSWRRCFELTAKYIQWNFWQYSYNIFHPSPSVNETQYKLEYFQLTQNLRKFYYFQHNNNYYQLWL